MRPPRQRVQPKLTRGSMVHIGAGPQMVQHVLAGVDGQTLTMRCRATFDVSDVAGPSDYEGAPPQCAIPVCKPCRGRVE